MAAVSHSYVVLAFVAVFVSQSVSTDFSGLWRLDPSRSSQTGAGPGRGRGAGDGTGGGLSLGPLADTLNIQRDATGFIVDEHRGSTVSRLTYRPDGASVENSIASGRNRGRSATYVSRWDGNRFVTTVTVPAPLDPANRASYQEAWSIGADQSLVVETLIPGRPSRLAVYVRARQ